MKFLITFEKGESVRWLGHLDILRTFERAIRRAEIPIAFTSGFNPRERIAFASALSVGVTASAEPATIELAEPFSAEDLITRLNAKLPPGIQLQSAEEIPDQGSRDLLNSYDFAEYRVTCAYSDPETSLKLQGAISSLLASDELPLQRERGGKTKTVDVRPFIRSVRVDGEVGSRIQLSMILGMGLDGVAKPQEVVELLAKWIPGLTVRRLHRQGLISREPAT